MNISLVAEKNTSFDGQSKLYVVPYIKLWHTYARNSFVESNTYLIPISFYLYLISIDGFNCSLESCCKSLQWANNYYGQ